MGLSYDLISEFVKITNDKKENTKEGTVYATVVSGTGGKYVRIDGSDLLTPMDTTTDIEDGERVTLMIKDHKAIVTGNVTTPSASTSKVDKVTESVNSISDRVGTFELVVADKVSTNELEAYKATIEVLIANKATIEDLTATNAKIENLEVKNAEIENLVAEKATIEDLEAVNATIENLKVKDAEIENAVVENLKATTADIKILNADFAQIKTLVNGNLTSDNILSFNLTSEKVTVDDAFIKDAMIDTISAGKINAGKINTNSVSIGSEDGGMLITGSTQQFTDKNGNVRIQIGKDASGDFTFILYGEDGQGQLINQNGITASAIGDGLIVNDMVSDHADISGGKLDISSVITEINSDNSTTIKSSKIYLNEQAQSLEVAFNSLKTKVDTFQEVTIQGELTAITEQVQSNTSKIEANKDSINTLISEDTAIKKQVTDLQGTLNETETTLNSKYTSLSQNLDGFKTTVADTYATKKSVTDVVDNIEANYSTTSVMNSAIEQKAQEISASVSSTYATKNEVSTLDNNLRTNYSTTQQMESAINVAKQEINLGVSTIYETKENVETKATSTLNSAKSYADTKKSEAISTAASDATSKANTAKQEAISTAATDATSKINSIKIGGSNLITKKSNFTYGYITTSNGALNNMQSLNSNQDFYTTEFIFVKSGTPITFTSYPKQGVTSTIQNAVYIHIYNTDKVWQRCASNETSANVVASKTYTTTDDCYVRFTARGFNDYNHMAEFATKPSEWTPAPEDIDSNITEAKNAAITSANNTLNSTISNYYTKTQTDSQINVAKEAIDLSVSTTYETKENVETKVTSTLNSAKSYADTKKSEAISTAASDATSKANTAKQEAITSANNTLNSTISNYYTKTQTDSQINVAKEEINLGVSSIYETKESTTSKIQNAVNNIQVGGTNLWVLSDITDGWVDASNGTVTGTGIQHKSRQTIIPINGAKQITYQCWNPNKVSNGGNANRVAFFDSNYNFIISYDILQINGETYQRQLINIPENAAYMRLGAICGPTDFYDETIKIKFELGNKPTDYSLAPEDVQSEFSTIESKTRSIREAMTSLQLGTDSISASVKSLEETVTNTTNGLASDISKVQDQVNLAMTSSDVKLEIQKEMSKGANKVSTSTGFTFDENGLNVSKSDSEMRTQITEDGMKIYKNDDIMLTANNQGVDAKNLHATTYLIIGGNSRMEDFIENGSKRTAIFWIGQS